MYEAYDLLEADAFDEWDAGLDFDVFDEDAFFEDEMLGFEDDEFLGNVWTWLTQPVPKQSGRGTTTRARRFGLTAARAALPAAGAAAGTALGGLAGGVGAPIGGVAGTALGQGVASLIPQEMDYLAALAAEAEDEAEAEAFLGALVPLAAQMLPQAAQAIMHVAPHLIRGLAGTVQAVQSNPAARQLLRTAGTVVRKTGADIARQVAKGRPVTGQMAVKQLARNTYRTMGDPRQLRRVAARAAAPAARPPRRGRPRCVRWA
jgi:hypothetical protein